jgi:methylenetetrahydrofolate dehydrogenase (NADP+)/methenyltetrahydrofolate cyclohydrolase
MEFELDTAQLEEAARQAEPGVMLGRPVADAVEAQVRSLVQQLDDRGIEPSLAVIQVGDDPASEIYIKYKQRACNRVGIDIRHVHLPADIDQASLITEIDNLTVEDGPDGLLLQLPLPDHLDPEPAIARIPADRDVDGFHVANLGALMAGAADLEPCTPRGVLRLLEAYDVDPRGKRAVMVGRSRVVGRPMAQMLVRADATVTICHRQTCELESIVTDAELLVVATGQGHLIPGEWIQEGAVVVDIGITRQADDSLIGDVEFDGARQRADLITPVPGGVGPMTVATLLENTVRASCLRRDLDVIDGDVDSASSGERP